MIVTSSGIVIGGSRLVINDSANIFLGTQNTLWSNPNNWNIGVVPNSNQIVIIRAICVIDTNPTVKNLIIESGVTLSYDSVTPRTLGVINIYDNQGTINMSAGNQNHNLVLNGDMLNSSGTFIAGTGGSRVTYSRDGNQNLLPLNYNILTVGTSGDKFASSNLTLAALTSSGTAFLNLGSFNFICNGSFTPSGILSNGVRKLSATGGTVFNSIAGSVSSNQNWSFANFPLIEFKNGLNIASLAVQAANLLFSTNNQNIITTDPHTTIFSGTMTLGSGISVTVGGGGMFQITGTTIGSNSTLTNSTTSLFGQSSKYGIINGVDSTSIFRNHGQLFYDQATAPMLTGQLQCNNTANIFKYNRGGAQDVTGGTYRTIEFGGSGVKRLLGNVIVNVTAGGGQSTTGGASINLNGFTITTI